jgi:hypothetical protein
MNLLITGLLLLGLLVTFFARVVFTEGTPADVSEVLGLIMLAGALGWRFTIFQKAQGSAKKIETWMLAAYAGVLATIVISSSFVVGAFAFEEGSDTGAIFAVAWPALFVVALVPLLFMEASYGFMPVPEAVDIRRVRGAGFGGLTIAFAFVLVVALNFVAFKRDITEDVSYFKVAMPSEGTLQAVSALDEPLKIVLVYPNGNEVLNRLRPFFQQIDRASDKVSVEVRDQALSPELARKHRVNDNGFIVLLQGEGESERAQQFEVGTDLVASRGNLKTLDGRFRRAFAQLTTIPREVYFTSGHREHTATGAEGDTRPEWTSDLTEAFRQSNINVRTLGLSQGLGDRVPEDAPAVAVIGPRDPFLPEEARALLEYAKTGGRVVVFVDPDVDHGLDPFLHGIGLGLEQGVVASERNSLRRTFTERDRTIVRTNRYSGHPTVTLAMRNSSRGVATVFIGGGSLVRHEGEDVVAGARSVFPITSSSDFWLDTNGNYTKDDGERQGQMNMVAAVTITREGDAKEGRVVVVADGDFVTDQVLRNPGNGLVISDVVDWLIGQESIVGDVSSEEDVPLERTVQEDKFYFWMPVLAVPLPIAFVGVWMGFRARRRKSARDPGEAKEAKKPAAPPPDDGDEAGDEEEESEEDESAQDESEEDESDDETASDEEDAGDDGEEDAGDEDAESDEEASGGEGDEGDEDSEDEDEEEKR